MAAVTETRVQSEHGERRFLIRNLGWDGYQTLLKLFEIKGPRITYDRGNVELMSPLIQHERPKKLLGYIIEAITDELEIPRRAAGSSTFNAEMLDRGIGPDDCYYFANAHRLRKFKKDDRFDFAIDPVPDLAIEVEITHALLDKLPIYAALGIPEIWHFAGEELKVLILEDGSYRQSETSLSFPFSPSCRWRTSSDSSWTTTRMTRAGADRSGNGSARRSCQDIGVRDAGTP